MTWNTIESYIWELYMTSVTEYTSDSSNNNSSNIQYQFSNKCIELAKMTLNITKSYICHLCMTRVTESQVSLLFCLANYFPVASHFVTDVPTN